MTLHIVVRGCAAPVADLLGVNAHDDGRTGQADHGSPRHRLDGSGVQPAGDLDKNPLTWLLEVNGLLVDGR